MRRIWLEDHIFDRFIMPDKFRERLHRLLDDLSWLQVVANLLDLPRRLLGLLVASLLELGG